LQSAPVFTDRAQDVTAQRAKAEPVVHLQMAKY
jgi:hypothetical protein